MKDQMSGVENAGPNVMGGKCRTWKCRTKTPGPKNGGPTAGSWLWNLISRHLWCLLLEVHCTGVIVNYDYVCDIKVLKTIAIEKQSKLLVEVHLSGWLQYVKLFLRGEQQRCSAFRSIGDASVEISTIKLGVTAAANCRVGVSCTSR